MHRYLLDTHALLWFLEGSNQFSAKAKAAANSPDAELLVSIASFWEIAIKSSLGKLDLYKPIEELAAHILESGFEVLPISVLDTIKVSQLPFLHRDPFDRIIIAQSATNNLALISGDTQLSQYDVEIIW
jgi:PIN domain nuclease of toxin-antitoxin system